jgi:capsular exopolysaccharide synthesis family protein
MTQDQPSRVGLPALGNPNETQGLRNLIWALRRRKLRILASITVLVALAVLFHWLTGPWYESMAQLLIIKKKLEPAPISGPPNTGGPTEEYLPTHMALVASPRVVGDAANKANLGSLPTFQHKKNVVSDAIEALFGQGLRGSPEERLRQAIIESLFCEIPKAGITPSHDVLNVSCRARTPEDCQAVLRAVIESYKQFLTDSHKNVNSETLEAIKLASEVLHKEIDAKTAEHIKFLQETPVQWRGKDGTNVDQERLFNLDQRRAVFRVRQEQISRSLKAVEEALQKGCSPAQAMALLLGLPDNRETLAPGLLNVSPDPWSVSSSTGRSMLEDELMNLQLQESKLSEQFGSAHPDVRNIRQRIETVQSMLDPSHAKSAKGDQAGMASLLQTKMNVLRQELDGNKRTEKALGELFENDQKAANKAMVNQLKDQAFRDGIERSRVLYDTIVSKLKEISSVQDYGWYETEVIGTPEPGKFFLKKYALVTGLALFVGLVGGVAWAYRTEVKDKSFRNSEEIHQELGLPILAHIPRLALSRRHQGERALEAGTQPGTGLNYRNGLSEVFGTLRTTVFFRKDADACKAVLVTSPEAGDGKTTLAANLAVSLARAGKRTLVIDADLRRPRLDAAYGLENQTGLTSVLAGATAFAGAVQQGPVKGLAVLTSGPLIPNPVEALTCARFKDLLDTVRNDYDAVLIDAPPVLGVTDACLVALRVDGVLLTLRMGRKGKVSAQRACSLLQAVGAHVLGVVVTGMNVTDDEYSAANYQRA